MPQFDTRDREGRLAYIAWLKETQSKPLSEFEDLEDALEVLSDYLGRPNWLVFPQSRNLSVPTGPRSQRSFPIPELIQFAQMLKKLSATDGFAGELRGLRNPAEFEDAYFTFRMADWCTTFPAVHAIRFAPKYSVKGRPKRPDFELATTLGDIVCECKRTHASDQKKFHTFESRARLVHDALKRRGIDPQYRVDVVINRRVHGPFDVIATRIAEEAGNLLKGEERVAQIGPVRIELLHRKRPLSHPKGHVYLGFVPINDENWTPIGPPESLSVVVSADVDIQQGLRRILREARDQLPRDRTCGIFINGRVAPIRAYLEAQLTQPAFTHVRFVAAIAGEDPGIAHRQSATGFVQQLFSTAMRHRTAAGSNS